MSDSNYNELISKRNFVRSVGVALKNKKPELLQSIDYEVFNVADNTVQEYLVIIYTSGAISARNCNMDSDIAIFYELAKMLDTKYYLEVTDYLKCKAKYKSIFNED